MHRILLVEDEPEIGQLISDWLAKHDMQVVVENRGDLALQRVQEEKPELILLDIMLPGMDGLSLCRKLRQSFHGPIVMLTSLDSDMNQVLALELGANDYILKTTPPNVLVARLRVQLRQLASITPQQPPKMSGRLQLGTLIIDYNSRDVRLQGQAVALSTSDFELLWQLASHSGQILSRETLFKQLKGREYDGIDRSMDVAISRLRQKLGDNAELPTRIKTIRNKGYLLVADEWS
ncbi:MAG: two-component system, OmpR family, response regulator RstA [Shewanella sp.]|jgi:two-component system response regulator RstA|uniref:two-component system response regulator RstA n=1 Tax=Shewanella TaxID=22 RepID=UPI001671C0CE|nr:MULTISPECIES: two-component system response regulator RstA [Shewanella]MBO1272852.1 two-component system response regulator RstA [Shewanella sp. 4t3-1-2LB]MCL2907843.1 two-component system response regulator RstA [Shewanella fodinae]MDN5369398.1 two-component system, OmpR family, response regulator RstA [Shewanella sp.]GGZ10987.1 DNA-binding response regulator [Shewanella fodinae]